VGPVDIVPDGSFPSATSFAKTAAAITSPHVAPVAPGTAGKAHQSSAVASAYVMTSWKPDTGSACCFFISNKFMFGSPILLKCRPPLPRMRIRVTVSGLLHIAPIISPL